MQYVSPEQLAVLRNRLKVGNRKVNVRVEVDKYVYTPSISTEMDYVQFYTDQKTPEITGGGEGSPNITSAAFMISPIKDKTPEETIANVSSEFAVKSVNGKQRFHPIHKVWKDHEGTDFNYGEGTELVAVADGVVTLVRTGGLNYINILHANGILTRYLHVGQIYVSEGTKVVQGQVIAKVGAKDAYSTGAHLHFEVRVNATKDSIGDPRDSVEYISRTKTIATVTEKAMDTTGTVTSSALRLRAGASTGDRIIKTMYKGDTVTINGKVGEWYKVVHGTDEGYAYGNYISVSSTGGSEPITRPGGNPTYDEIAYYIRQECAKVGLPVQVGLAIAWTESEWTQFDSDGSPYGSVTNDWGIMQINQDGHPSAFPDAKTDWKYNVRYGIAYAIEKYNKAVQLGEQDVARATYSAYNTGIDYDRYRTESDPRDTRFWNIYQTSPWSNYLNVGSGDGSIFGTVTGSVVNVRSTPEILETNILTTVTKGMNIESLGLETGGKWYKIKLQDGRIGYISATYFKVNTDNITVDYSVEKFYEDDFEKYTLYSIPKNYSQDEDKLWKVQNDGVSNVMAISGGALKTNYFQYVVNLPQTGRLDLNYKLDLSDGNTFCVYVDDYLVFRKTGTTSTYLTASIPLLSGNHTIKIARIKSIDGNDKIMIDNLKISKYVYREGQKFYSPVGSLAEVDVNVTYTDSLTVNGDGVPVYSAKDTTSPVILTANRGQVFPSVECAYGEWATIIVEGQEAYVVYDNTVTVTPGGYEYNQLKVKSGGFVYERTLTLDNVMSINIDRRYELRAATAMITISNESGYFSPDYIPTNFPEKGVKKSPFVEYYDGDPLGVLTENTPVRIYIGYGDNPPRRFTGVIDLVDIDGESQTLTIYCTDMMKKLNDYLAYKEMQYPPNGDTKVAWLASSVIHDLANVAGLSGWRRVEDDLHYPDIVVEETYYTELNPESGIVTLMDENGNPYAVTIESLPVDGGYSNPFVYYNKIIPRGTCLADEIDEICQNISYWQRCDAFGTYRCTPISISDVPVAYFKDTETIISIMKTIDSTKVKNHIIVAGAGREEHFFDMDLWKASKGVRKSAMITVPWADTYGKKQVVAEKLFKDMKILTRTMQVVIEGNPYLELLDTVGIEHSKTTTKDNYHVKGMRESWNDSQGYLQVLDLFWLGG